MKNRAGTPGDGPRTHREAQRKAWIPALALIIAVLCIGVGMTGFIFNERTTINETKIWSDYTQSIQEVDTIGEVKKDWDGLPITFHGVPTLKVLSYTDDGDDGYRMKEGSGPALALRVVVEQYQKKGDEDGVWVQIDQAKETTMNMRTKWIFSQDARVGKYNICPPDSERAKDNNRAESQHVRADEQGSALELDLADPPPNTPMSDTRKCPILATPMIVQQMRLRELPVKQDEKDKDQEAENSDTSSSLELGERHLHDIDMHDPRRISFLQMSEVSDLDEHGKGKHKHRSRQHHSHSHKNKHLESAGMSEIRADDDEEGGRKENDDDSNTEGTGSSGKKAKEGKGSSGKKQKKAKPHARATKDPDSPEQEALKAHENKIAKQKNEDDAAIKASDAQNKVSDGKISSAKQLDQHGHRDGTYLYNREIEEGKEENGDLRVSFDYFAPVAGSEKDAKPEVTVLAMQQRELDAEQAYLARWETTDPTLDGKPPVFFVWDQQTSWKVGLRKQIDAVGNVFSWVWRGVSCVTIYLGFMLLIEPEVDIGSLCGEGCRKTQHSCHGAVRLFLGFCMTFFVISLIAAILWGVMYQAMLALPLGVVSLTCFALMCLIMFRCRRRIKLDEDSPSYRSPFVGAQIVIIEARPGQGMQGTILGTKEGSSPQAYLIETLDGRNVDLTESEFVLKERNLHAGPTKGAIVFIPRPETDRDLEGTIITIRDHPRPLAPGERRPSRGKSSHHKDMIRTYTVDLEDGRTVELVAGDFAMLEDQADLPDLASEEAHDEVAPLTGAAADRSRSNYGTQASSTIMGGAFYEPESSLRQFSPSHGQSQRSIEPTGFYEPTVPGHSTRGATSHSNLTGQHSRGGPATPPRGTHRDQN